jgi:alpha-glucosidase (family GH31 glycosyl hydrolase)
MGHMQAKRTYDVLKSAFKETPLNDTRPFIMSRSTFAGSGHYAQHWIAELKRDFSALRQSIAAVMNFNMFGIPFTGADVCGKYAGSVAAE